MNFSIKEGQPNPDLPPVQNPEQTLVSISQGRQSDLNILAMQNPEQTFVSFKQEGSQTLTYNLFRTQRGPCQH